MAPDRDDHADASKGKARPAETFGKRLAYVPEQIPAKAVAGRAEVVLARFAAQIVKDRAVIEHEMGGTAISVMIATTGAIQMRRGHRPRLLHKLAVMTWTSASTAGHLVAQASPAPIPART
jgi:hypothetical protein